MRPVRRCEKTFIPCGTRMWISAVKRSVMKPVVGNQRAA